MSSFAAASVAQLATAARRCRSRTPDEPTARERLASLAKPPGSLGTLEDWAAVLCAAQQTLRPAADPASVLVFCGDHGVKKADDGLSPFPPSVSQAVFRALAAGVSATAVLARAAGAHLTVVDVGLDGDVRDARARAGARVAVRHAKVARGTADMRAAAAMDEGAFERALQAGRDCVAGEVAARGARVVAIGEAGIGNTTAAAAVLCALSRADPAECVGRGTGLDDVGVRRKAQAVRDACAFHAAALPDAPAARAREALRRLGGLELAAMAGAYEAAARAGVVAVVDGFISAVAALCAARMHPACRATMVFATGLAEEPSSRRGGELLEAALDAKPALAMGLRLGEASGAALALPLLRAAAAVVAEMGTLEEVLSLGQPSKAQLSAVAGC